MSNVASGRTAIAARLSPAISRSSPRTTGAPASRIRIAPQATGEGGRRANGRLVGRHAALLLFVAVLTVVAVLVLHEDEAGRQGLVPEAGADNDPLAWSPGREQAFVEAAARGHAHVLYAKSPGGARA